MIWDTSIYPDTNLRPIGDDWREATPLSVCGAFYLQNSQTSYFRTLDCSLSYKVLCQRKVALEEPTTTTEEDSSTTEEGPSTTEEDPSTTEEDPSTTEEDPSTTEEDPSTTQEDPSTTEEDPSTTEEGN